MYFLGFPTLEAGNVFIFVVSIRASHTKIEVLCEFLLLSENIETQNVHFNAGIHKFCFNGVELVRLYFGKFKWTNCFGFQFSIRCSMK